MTNQTDNFPADLMSDDSFEVVMRGYSRRQVHDYMIRTRNQIRDLEERLARTIDQAEQSRMELAEARRKMSGSPQNPDELGERLSQILKLAHEEAAANKQASEAEATRLRDSASGEAERLVASAREQADAIRAAAQQEAERRVADATATAERMLSQAGADADETLGTARAEAEEALRNARGEADRQLTAARNESERLLTEAHAQADAMLAAAQQRVTTLDEHTGRRVAYLRDTHTEVVRRLNEIGSVLGDLMHREAAAGPLIDEAAVLPPAPIVQQAVPEAQAHPQQQRQEPVVEAEHVEGQNGAPRVDDADKVDDADIRVIVDDEQGEGSAPAAEDTDINLARVRHTHDGQAPSHSK
jgi:cell division septum initiation protein DivIVA